MCTLDILLFHAVLPFRSYRNDLNGFPEDKTSTIYPCHSVPKVFTPSGIVVHCLSIVLSVKTRMSKSYSHSWKGVKYKYVAWKINNVQDLDDFSQDQWTVQLLMTNNLHKTKKQTSIIQLATDIKYHMFINFWTGSFV